MPKFTDAMTSESLARWYTLMHEMGIAYKAHDTKRMIEINTELEDIEDIAKEMVIIPGFDRRED